MKKILLVIPLMASLQFSIAYGAPISDTVSDEPSRSSFVDREISSLDDSRKCPCHNAYTEHAISANSPSDCELACKGNRNGAMCGNVFKPLNWTDPEPSACR